MKPTYIVEKNLLYSKSPGLNVILIAMARLVFYQVSDCHDLVNLTHKFKYHLVISIIIHFKCKVYILYSLFDIILDKLEKGEVRD